MSVPNQNIIIIHREYPEKNFLQIKNENWQNLLLQTREDYPALALYLYLASNRNDYRLDLSPQAIKNNIGMPKSTFYNKLQILKDHGYIIEKKGNILDFYEVPQKQNNAKSNLPQKPQNPSCVQQNPPQKQNSLSQKQDCPQNNREIDNKYINNIDNKNNTHNETVIINSNQNEVEEFVF